MNQDLRNKVFAKFSGLCAYTGRPLEEDWQVDHITPKCHYIWHQSWNDKHVDGIENLYPALKIVNHYKRSLDLEQFRKYMLDFHKRLAKLPKKTSVNATERRIKYMNDIANRFNITVDKPFIGKFYFETITHEN
jgi:5-methylcytosine-specific restriction endonuclease McrA